MDRISACNEHVVLKGKTGEYPLQNKGELLHLLLANPPLLLLLLHQILARGLRLGLEGPAELQNALGGDLVK